MKQRNEINLEASDLYYQWIQSFTRLSDSEACNWNISFLVGNCFFV